MRHPLTLVAIVLLGGTMTATAGAQAPPARATPATSVRAQIERRNAAFATSVVGSDGPAAVAAFYTPDAQVLPPNAPAVTGRAAIGAFWRGPNGGPPGPLRLETVDVEPGPGGQTATEVGRYTITLPSGTVVDEGKYIVLWRRVNGTWYLHRDMWNSDRPPTPPAR